MSHGTVMKAEFHPIIVYVCDGCGREHHRDDHMHAPPLGWLIVRMVTQEEHEPVNRDFCSEGCLRTYYRSSPA